MRMIATMARRVGANDIDEFGALLEVRAAADAAVADAIDRLRARGHSWDALAARAGVSRQSLTEWRGRRPAQPGRRETLHPGGGEAR